MHDLLLVGLAGFLASLVDGALGMGFGPPSSSILLSTGLSPAAVSTTVNLAKVASGLAAALSHWRFGNIDRGLVIRLAVPGMVGALIGVTVLANVPADKIRPILAALLFLVAAVTPLEVAGFGAALVGALVLSLVSLVLSWALKD